MTIWALLSNPIFLLILAVLFIIFAFTGVLFCLFAPNLIAGVAFIIIGFLVIWKLPIPNLYAKYGMGLGLMVFGVIVFLEPGIIGLQVVAP